MTTLSDFTLIKDDNPLDVHAQFDDLRSRCPMAFTSDNGGFWMLSKYEDVKRCASDHKFFVSSVKAVIPSDPRGIRRPPLNTDPPAHTPYRTALDRTLKPARILKLESVLTEHATREFAKMVKAGGGDMCGDFGASYAAWVEVSWLNLADDTAPELARTATAWINAWRQQNGPETTIQSEKLYTIARQLFAQRRANPMDPEQDPCSSLLLEKGPDGEPLSDELLVATLRQSLVVGMVAPPIIIGSICNHLSGDKELQQKLREDPSLVDAAVEEFLRLYVPYRGFCRTPKENFELHGRVIEANQPISMTYAAANRDPEVFEDPHKFILNRPNATSHLGFGRGRHRCAGMPLARMALRVALRVILRDSADIEVSGPLSYAKMPEMGITKCPVIIKGAGDR